MADWTSTATTKRAATVAGARRGRNQARGSRGFTLIEVLVAVAVVGIALAAIIKVSAESGYNLNHLRDRTMAQWVASDRLVELQAMQYWGSGRDRGQRELAGRTWYWETEISNTPIAQLRQIEVRVYDREGGEHPITRLQGLISDPQVRGTPQ